MQTKEERYLTRQIKLTIEEAAYIAGILDGEGSISTPSKGMMIGRTYIAIVNTSKDLMDWLGIKLRRKVTVKRYIHIPPIDGREVKTWKDAWVIQVSGFNAYHILKLLLPYLIVKKELALRAIKYYDSIKNLPCGELSKLK